MKGKRKRKLTKKYMKLIAQWSEYLNIIINKTNLFNTLEDYK